MCGICGIWNFGSDEPVDRDVVAAMTRRIHHRGPDEEGIHVEGPLGLGFRRLSIVDLAHSHQPMSNADRSAWITFNGEIYNFRELRQGLETRFAFHTSGDTETLLHLLELKGSAALSDLVGMFAFAFWDATQRSLLLAVDRFGKKPLYYSIHGGRLIFGSELKVFRDVPGLDLDLDPEALDEFLCSGFVNAPRSIFRTIRKVPPGHFLKVDSSGRVELHCYWQPSFGSPDSFRDDPPEILASGLRLLLEEAIGCRLMSEVPLGAFLSGGLDSSAVVALMARRLSHRVQTFSIGFEDDPNDESQFSALMARHCGTLHTHEVLSPRQLMDWVPGLIEHMDEPFADDSIIPTWFVSKVARQAVTVCLSGDGGDEIFGGYTWYRRAWRQDRLRRSVPSPLRSVVAPVGRILPQKYGDYLARIDQDPAIWRTLSPYFPTPLRHALYRPEFSRHLGCFDADRNRSVTIPDAGSLPLLSRLQSLDISGYLPGGILVKVDRLSMKESLEVRCPLLDHRIFEYMSRISPDVKLNVSGSKWLFQQALQDVLPPDILRRRKRGFDVPLLRWLSGPLTPLLEDLRSAPSLVLHRWLEPSVVTRILSSIPPTDLSQASRLWSLVCLELWARSWFASPRP